MFLTIISIGRYRYFGLERDVIKSLIEDYNYSQSDAEKAIGDYKPVFKILENDKYVEPWRVAFRIKSDREHGWPPSHYIESLGFLNESSEMLAGIMKMPDNNTRNHEFCQKCGYPKYVDQECRFCK